MLRWILLTGLLTATACDTVRNSTDVRPPERAFDPLPAQADSALTRHHIWHRWKTPELAWHAQVLSGPHDPDTLSRAVTDAFEVWAEESSLTFQAVLDARAADLRIAITDQLPCDVATCPVGVAWFPGHPERPGEILLRAGHLPTTRVALAEVVLHFAGHALGLEHVQDTWSAMSVMARPEGRWGGLGHEDRLAIRGRYGRPGRVPPEEPVPTHDMWIPSCVGARPSGLNSLYPDSDGDSLPDAIERFVLGTDPAACDTDFDDLSDAESYWGLNPLASDTDGDGSVDSQEVGAGGNPFRTQPPVGIPLGANWRLHGQFEGVDQTGRQLSFVGSGSFGAEGSIRLPWNSGHIEVFVHGGVDAQERFWIRSLDGRLEYRAERFDASLQGTYTFGAREEGNWSAAMR
ncbi:MAG: hypothetical protein ACI80V_002182 [Rhodothermales bacterium]|jgi:hypothetical protein